MTDGTDVRDPNSYDEQGRPGEHHDGSGEGFVPPNDGSWIPRERAMEMVDHAITRATAPLREELAELRGTVSGGRQQNQQQQPVNYSREQLEAFVAEGRISESQAQNILDQQRERQMQELVQNTVKESLTNHQRTEAVTGGLAEYQRLVPEVMTPGSAERQRVENQYRYLVSIGQPETKATELVALQTVFGPIDNLRERKRNDTSGYQTHQDGGAGGGYEQPRGGDRGRRQDRRAELTADEKRYYGDLISKGIYRDWDQVHAELKHADGRVRSRHGAAA